MEALADMLIQLAVQYKYVAIPVIATGLLYWALITFRGLVMGIVTLTKTDKDNKVVDAIYAFCDKYGPGLGKLKEYSEAWLNSLQKKANK